SWLPYFGRIDEGLTESARKEIPPKLRRFCTEPTIWGVAATKQALAQAGSEPDTAAPERRSLFTAEQCNRYPGVQSYMKWLTSCGKDKQLDVKQFAHEVLESRSMPLVFLKSLRNNLLSVASRLFQCKGDCGSYGQDEGAALAALRNAVFSLRHGYSDQALVIATGSSDEAWTLCELRAEQYLSQGTEGARSFRPYDRSRDGMFLGEGAVALVLESEQRAERRGAEPLGELLAISSQVVAPGDGNKRRDPYAACLDRVLRGATTSPYEIGVVCANGKGTAKGDLYQLRLMEQALGPVAPQTQVTCSTPLTGMLGTVGALVDVVICLYMLRKQTVPPIAHLQNPELTTLHLCYGQPVKYSGRHAVAFNLGLSGFHSATLVHAA
ncbi:MAG: beta-ketoacyl synthase N-terminal-like domain-containing protein, partial [Gammaproteobacteria bacterium]